MPKFTCSYAQDIACYADFVVEAKTEKAALRQIKKALRQGRFNTVAPQPCPENGAFNPRVFVLGPAGQDDCTPTLQELTGEDARGSDDPLECVTSQQPSTP